ECACPPGRCLLCCLDVSDESGAWAGAWRVRPAFTICSPVGTAERLTESLRNMHVKLQPKMPIFRALKHRERAVTASISGCFERHKFCAACLLIAQTSNAICKLFRIKSYCV